MRSPLIKQTLISSVILAAVLGLAFGPVGAQNPAPRPQGQPLPGTNPQRQIALPPVDAEAVLAWRYKETWEKTIGLVRLLQLELETKDFEGPILLGEFLNLLQEKVEGVHKKELSLILNTEAFTDFIEKKANLRETEISFPTYPKKMTIDQILRVSLSQIPWLKDNQKATFLIRSGQIFITTVHQARPLALLEGKFATSFDRTPLQLAILELSGRSGVTVTLDPRAGQKLNTPISATFLNDTTFRSALSMLANMARLRVVEMETGLYLTSEDNIIYSR